LSECYVLLTTLTAESFSFGLQISMGVITALLLVLIGFAVISRVAPMINLMSVGWSVNMLLTLGVVLVSIGTIITVFSQFAADKLGAF
ncbi:MAG: flagellar biosynthetic protein FliR, partial [Thermoguttaceae bacterium]|nr:flagellar biosynthetic protein FliR [Thermoguttaceae bacterium]